MFVVCSMQIEVCSVYGIICGVLSVVCGAVCSVLFSVQSLSIIGDSGDRHQNGKWKLRINWKARM